MRIRRQTVEYFFGILKAWMGVIYFLICILENVKTEMSLQILAYNLKRVMNLLGVTALLAALRAA